MEKASSNIENSHYNDEALFLDGVSEFHPDIIEALSTEDRDILKKYYLIGEPTPENIFVYRKELIAANPEIEAKAKAVFAKVLHALNIDNFEYSS